jgi:hypothetical protein
VIHSQVVPEQLSLKLVEAKRNTMDCVATKSISARCSVCRKYDSTVHAVGTAFYCARHCPVHEQGRRLAIAGEPEPGITEELTLA